MTAPVNKMLRGMEEYFLAQDAVLLEISRRLTRGLAEIRIVAQEKPEQTIASREQRFAEYDLAGAPRGNLLNVKSKFHTTAVDFRFFGKYPATAAAVFDAFYGCWTDKLSTTWGSGTDYETKVMGAWWDDASATDDRDQTLGMSFMGVTLVVPFAVV